MDITAFWGRVKFLIKAHKTTQKKIALYIGLSYNTFRNWIFCKRVPDLETAVNLSVALGVSLDYLVFGKERNVTKERMNRLLERKTAAARINRLAKVIVNQSEEI